MNAINPAQTTPETLLCASQSQALMTLLSRWRNTTTVIISAGCVFEFKGSFPPGTVAEGYYNLTGNAAGFHGHIKLQAITQITLVARQHRGMDSYAFVFEDRKGLPIFKIYLGRDSEGQIHPEQLTQFREIQATGQLPVITAQEETTHA